MMELNITPSEIESRQMTAEHLQAAKQAMAEDGFVILNNVVDLGHIGMLREKMLADIATILHREEVPYQFTTGHIQHDPPPFPPYLFRDVLLNDMAVAVSVAVLGKHPKNTFYSGNTNLPGSGTQPVHVDLGQLWPNLEKAHPPYALVINVPVVDMDENNGSTEIWPGTHLDTTMSIDMETLRLPEDVLERRRAVCPPIQPRVKAGSMLLRDMRLWHRGVPNHTKRARPMIAMIYWVHWWHTNEMLTFPKGTEALFENSELHTHARFVEAPIDYLSRHTPFDYQPTTNNG